MKLTGWLAPDGSFLEVESNEHIKNLEKFSIVRERIPEILEMIESLKAKYAEHEAVENGSDAEWHLYEIESDGVDYKIWKLMLNRGFIRVQEMMNGEIHFEGRPNVLKSKLHLCQRLANECGASVVLDPKR